MFPIAWINGDTEEDRANAGLIVQAVNAHEQLMAAVWTAREYLTSRLHRAVQNGEDLTPLEYELLDTLTKAHMAGKEAQ